MLTHRLPLLVGLASLTWSLAPQAHACLPWPEEILHPSREPLGLTTADFNGDGYLDVAAAMWTAGLELHPGTAGGFAPALPLAHGVGVPADVAAGDFDGDGDADLVVSGSSNQIAWLENTGAAFAPSVQVGAESNAWVQGADVDADGT